MFRLLLVFIILPLSLFAAGVSYSVTFEGLNNPSALRTIKSVAQLTSLKKRPPASLNALRYRAESDIPEILRVLHAYGYYEAEVQIRVEETWNLAQVIVTIHPGPAYILEEFQIDLYEQVHDQKISCKRAKPKNIGIALGKPIVAFNILEAEQKLLQLLAECGYPLAEIEQREIIADGEKKSVRILLEVRTGSIAQFGDTKIVGLKTLKPKYVEQKELWKEGELYDSRKVEKTQKDLIETGLFNSVLITHGDDVMDENKLPMQIEVAESKHRSIHVGASYQTFFGPGITFGWENRNIDGMGRRLSLQGDVTRKTHSGVAALVIPDFQRLDQDLVWEAIAMHESIRAFSERSYGLSGRLERRVGRRFRFAISGHGERLFVTSSVDNGIFWVLEMPLYLRWSSANSLLDPTKGATLEYLGEPAASIESEHPVYLKQRIVQSCYWPLLSNHKIVLAQKVTFGSIVSSHLGDVPVPKRFFGGSEEDLRGYQYFTVSPLRDGDKPIGGRSALFYTLEMRFRISKPLGIVPFFDMGNVYETPLPKMTGRWFKSVGLGLRYFSFVGPIRFDVGFPLQKRKEIDRTCRLLVSIGQMF